MRVPAHTTGMKSKFLTVVAICFVCALALFLFTANKQSARHVPAVKRVVYRLAP